MTRTFVLGLALCVALVACKKEDKAKEGSGATATGSTAGSAPAATGSSAAGSAAPADQATPPPKVTASNCKAACEHRASCVDSASDTCVEDCNRLTVIPGVIDTKAYLATDCDTVKQYDSSVSLLLGCGAACERRSGCVEGKPDLGQCVGDCTALAQVVGVDEMLPQVEKARTDSCDEYRKAEPEWQMISTCVASCKHVLKCGVAGTFEGCIKECAQRIQNKQLTLAQVKEIQGQDCGTVKQTIKLESGQPPPPPAGNVDVGACLSRGAHTCGPFMMCCRMGASRLTRPGEPGLCTYAAICYGPTR